MHEDPDLILAVTREPPSGDQSRLKFAAKTRDPQLGLYWQGFESESFRGKPEDHFREFFEDIARMTPDPSVEWIAGRGAQLFRELIPKELQRRLWALRDAVRTVQVVSEEVWIPWELLRLQNPDDRSPVGPFLVEAFNLTRWLPSPPVLELPMRRIALVIPRDSNLPSSVLEGQRLRTLAGAARDVVEIRATFPEVRDAMASGHYDSWHFAGHGLTGQGGPHSWSIMLEGGERLRAAHLYASARNLGTSKPLVFLNACHSGRGAPSLTGMAGLASAFLEAGAGAFLGSHWGLEDESAFCFAEEFYKHLFAGVEIGEAVRQARSRLRAFCPTGNDWLAYTVFAHPLASCTATATARLARKKVQKPLGSKKKRNALPRPAFFQVTGLRRSSPVEVIELTSREPCVELPFKPKSLSGTAPGEERIHKKDGMVLVYVPGGEFTLGAEGVHPWSRPVRRVYLTSFWIGRYLVTNEQYALFLKENLGRPVPTYWLDPHFNPPQHPVVGLSWEEAQAYCHWAGCELPSEAQWEAAARGTDQRAYPWGNELPTPHHANFGGASRGTTPVGAFPAGAGPYGTLDQAGNVWEWCLDPWASNAHQQMEDGEWDPVSCGETNAVRAMRGGSWMNPARDLHSAYRDRGTANMRLKNQGFRCVWRPS